jgi:pseudouridine-5'-phosphate glycosidase
MPLALESTLIAHGLPYPQNLATARELEALARAHGVEPRTIVLLDGEIKVGSGTPGIMQLPLLSIVFASARVGV